MGLRTRRTALTLKIPASHRVQVACPPSEAGFLSGAFTPAIFQAKAPLSFGNNPNTIRFCEECSDYFLSRMRNFLHK